MPILSDIDIDEWILEQAEVSKTIVKFLSEKNFLEFDLKKSLLKKIEDPYKTLTGRTYRQFQPNIECPYPSSISPLTNIYFYYFGFDQENAIFCRIFERKISPTNDTDVPNDIVREWIKKSRNSSAGGHFSPQDGYLGNNPNNIFWNSPSYLTFFIDSPAWEFLELNTNAGKNQNMSIHFFSDSDNRKNQSFFRSRTQNITFDSETAKIIVVDNYHIKAGSPIGRRRDRTDHDNSDQYKFDLYYRIRLDKSSDLKKSLIMIIDPSSRNTGP